MTTRRVLIGVGVGLLVLFLIAIFAGSIIFGRTGYFMGPGMMGGYGFGGHMYGSGFGGHMYGGGFGWIGVILFWLLVLGGLVLLVRYLVRRGTMHGQKNEVLGPTGELPKGETPLDIAKRRYASGEIDGDEFERIKQSLMS